MRAGVEALADLSRTLLVTRPMRNSGATPGIRFLWGFYWFDCSTGQASLIYENKSQSLPSKMTPHGIEPGGCWPPTELTTEATLSSLRKK
jgi:hypothetical protein